MRQPILDRAVTLAIDAHEGQLDKGGQPYVLHPLRVMAALAGRGEAVQAVGVLHDVVEDTPVTLEALRLMGFPEEVVRGVDAMSRRDGEVYREYVDRVAADPVGLVVKEADVRDNLSPERLAALPEKEARSMSKRYLRTLEQLAAARDRNVTQGVTTGE